MRTPMLGFAKFFYCLSVMPELPEVETTRRGIEPYLVGQRVTRVIVRERRLRWPIPEDLDVRLSGQRIEAVERRAKYLLIKAEAGTLIAHLGMSGSLRLVDAELPHGKHEHVDIVLESGMALRYTDPRRFGALLWSNDPLSHTLLASLGPEPLGDEFDGDRLFRMSRGRSMAVKPFIMDNAVVVGVGNIYASEALFAAGIDPRRAAGTVSRARYLKLAEEIRRILACAIERGGTTLRDFVGGDGKPGYFQQELFVYGRGGEFCKNCGSTLRETRLGQRASVHCIRCQR